MTLFARIRISVEHSDPLVCEGLVAAFARCDDIELPSPSSPDACQPDVVVADYARAMLRLSDSAAGAVRRPHVVIVTGVDREWEIRHAVERGVRGYFLAGCAVAEIADGVRAAVRGQRHLGAGVATRLADSLAVDALTGREEDVLRLVAGGLCNKSIGRRLGIAVGTVKSHLKSSFEKLGVTSRTQAAAAIGRRGLLGDVSARHASAVVPVAGLRLVGGGVAGRIVPAQRVLVEAIAS